MNQFELQSLKDAVAEIARKQAELEANFTKNNFSSEQIFTKRANFTTKIQTPVYTVLPPGQPGEVLTYSTDGTYKFMVCTATDTWTICGTQS